MASLLIVFFALVVSFLSHIMLHKKSAGIRNCFVYIAGSLPVTALLIHFQSPYVISSIILYLLISIVISYEYFGVLLGGETPSSMVLHALGSKTALSRKQIEGLFTEEHLLWKRIENLQSSGLIRISKSVMISTAAGNRAVFLIRLYRTLFHRLLGG